VASATGCWPVERSILICGGFAGAQKVKEIESKNNFSPPFFFFFFRQALNTTTTTKDKLLHPSYIFSLFLTVSLLFKCRFVA